MKRPTTKVLLLTIIKRLDKIETRLDKHGKILERHEQIFKRNNLK